jgi:ribosomal protein S18 acetylase RimI-like enzyme
VSSRVRPARPADAGPIGRIHSESWRVTYAGLLSPRYLATLDRDVLAERWQRQLDARAETGSLLVAEEDGQVVGFSTFGPTAGDPDLGGFAGEIQMLYVHPAGWRRGHGRALFERAAADLAARPLYWLVVWVVEANHAARAFYRRVGLACDGVRRVDRLAGEAIEVVRYAGALNPLIDYAALLRR